MHGSMLSHSHSLFVQVTIQDDLLCTMKFRLEKKNQFVYLNSGTVLYYEVINVRSCSILTTVTECMSLNVAHSQFQVTAISSITFAESQG